MNAAASVPGLTPGELRQRVSAVAGMIEGDGIVAGSDADGRPRPLRVDPGPLILGAVEWAGLERALAQRATLLDLVLADLYGPRALVTRGLVPPQIVVGHPGFFAAAAGIPTRGALLTTAADLGKDADGQWRVLADRTQRPLGAGYAMAIRRVIARALAPVHRATPLRRLRGYFDALRSGLLELGATASEAPRVVMLRSPEEEEAAFDEMFAATLLGFPVVVADDLALRGGRLWLTTTGRDEPVDVLVRRVDARRADPLDLAPGSDAGIPGLVEATRRGNVRVVNPVGAGVLENPALGAFLPAISRALLDEDLLLPSARTWWCGEDAGRRHAADHLDDIVLAPLASLPGRGRVFTAELTRDERAALWARVESEPWAWCAQEVLPPWDVELVGTPGTAARAG
ncbi:MAG: circularly permuted type 2 ATP-grasp protein, partial [Propioniciclava sp.]